MLRLPDRFPLLVTESGDSCIDDTLDAVRVTSVGGGPESSVLVTDIQDGAGDSVMDPVNDAIRVNVVAEGGGSNPQISPVTQATVAAGATADLDSAAIGSGLTGHLLQVVAASSVPFKVEIQTVQNGVPSATLLVAITSDRNWTWSAPGRGFITAAHDAGVGFDGFRAVITNLDTSEPADVYVTFFYDEV